MARSANRIPIVLPIFPLPNVVFFPKVYLPLHIFEPRYREMVKDSLASSKIIAMALLKGVWEKDYFSNPDTYDVGCAGEIVSVNALQDGRYDIVLHGLEEVKFKREFVSKAYRQSEVDLFMTEKDNCLHEGRREELRQTLNQYLEAKTKHVEDEWFHQLLKLLEDPRVDDERWVNFFSFSLDLPYVEKQSLLEAGSLDERGKSLTEILKFHLVEQSFINQEAMGSGSPH